MNSYVSTRVKCATIQPYLKFLLGFGPRTSDARVRAEWNRRTKSVCKPCWELKYCPYGPLVEQFPLPPVARAEMVEHNDRLKALLEQGIKDPAKRRSVEAMVASFDPNDYPVKPDNSDDEKACTVFGHYCPVFFVNEPFTETREQRRVGRNIPRSVMLRVVRRDNNQCQRCGRVLKDGSEEHNVRVSCLDCNRTKGATYEP